MFPARDGIIPRPLILAYHSVNSERTDNLAVRTSDFRRQLEWLRRRGYVAITLQRYLMEGSTSKRTAIITFDDGYADNYTQAFPVLKEYGFRATVFLVSDYVGTERIYPWDRARARGRAESYRALAWKQVHEMQEWGVEFGSHTCTHPRLAEIDADISREEIRRSRDDLAAKLGREVVSFSYPQGNLNAKVVAAVRDSGYSGAVVTPTRQGLPHSSFLLRRVGVYYPNNDWVFRLKTTRLFRNNYERLQGLRDRCS